MIRALYRNAKISTAVPPHDTLTMKVYYPAAPTNSETERMTGVIPADVGQALLPVVIILPGINVGMEAYQWLAMQLAADSMVVVTYSWIAEEMPGYISLTPGVDLTAVSPTTYGTKPTCLAIQPILDALQQLNDTDDNPLAGHLDLNCVILGGHSAGGTMVLQNCNPDWFPQIQGAFSYAGHTMAATMLGYDTGTILSVSGKRPLLLIGGSHDGVIEASTVRYGLPPDPTLAIKRTFNEAINSNRNDCALLILNGANHFTMAYPVDETTGRPFLDHHTTQPDTLLRDELATLITLFIDGYIRHQTEVKGTFKHQLNNNPLISHWEMK
ncbi:MAG: dienelactone hydrolase [Chloroflexi bacterium]|nr:dienelactone hydrolase [Chloroflexota bacterium]